MTTYIRESLRAEDGLVLQLHRWEPECPAGRMVLLHGRGEHGARYDELARRAASLGLACAAVDLRGHGRSEGIRGSLRRFDEYLLDLRAALERLPPAPRWFLFGHSAGALVALRWLQTATAGPRFDGLVLSSPFLALARPLSRPKRALVWLLSRLAPHHRLPNSGVDHLTRDPAVRRALLDDPLAVPCATVRWLDEALAAQREALRDAPRLVLPVLLQQAGVDRAVDPAAARTLYDALGSTDRSLIQYAGLYHEIYQELAPERERVVADLCAWLGKRFA